MSVAANEVVPEPVGGGPGASAGAAPARLRPRAASPGAAPTRARRMDIRPLPRLRPLAEVLAELGTIPDEVPPERADPDPAAGGPAWDAALEAACGQVGPLAVALLTAVAEVVDGRRPLGHLARLCPPALVERVRAGLGRVRPGFPRGARVRGLRLCPVVGSPGPDGVPGLAVEVAAALAGEGRARAAVARFELDASRTWRATELAVL
ncbi:Rv3235 family protein [Actinomycetospora sp. TBRC 11914]|uniref:Rv3235 family protein n=1 Tax=Actinomycetospora sp. TBRC 11914 TaxID=2729387 RepID=UPI00145D44A3|nr:Rv3235 family protein [Actinomycetospora sp. TBRC 11914]NMO90761.1 hypothetical protein [Actinomycetospora sp. TBRC 11914]